jgi:hypothetical protein
MEIVQYTYREQTCIASALYALDKFTVGWNFVAVANVALLQDVACHNVE